MTLEQGDIALVPVPFTDLSAIKRRPVLILSGTRYNRHAPDVIVAAITSNLTAAPHRVLIAAKDVTEGTLKKTSMVRSDKLYTLSRDIIIRRFGRLNSAILSLVFEEMDRVLERT